MAVSFPPSTFSRGVESDVNREVDLAGKKCEEVDGAREFV